MSDLGMFECIDISSSGLSAQRVRMNTIANNLANVNTTRTPEGGPFRKEQVIFEAVMKQELEAGETAGNGVKVVEVKKDTGSPILVYNPSHPDANSDGYVAYPDINPVEEMVNMISASKSFEANVTCVMASKAMINSSIDIIRQ